MKLTIIKFQLLVVLMLVAKVSQAQDDFIVLHSNDTLRGQVLLEVGDINRTDQVILKQKGKSKQIIPTYKINFIHRKKYGNYRLLKTETRNELVLIVSEGKFMNYYRYVITNTTYKSGFTGHLLVKGNDQFALSSFTFKKTIADAMNDCPPILKQINDGEFKKKDLEKMVREYNNCRDNGNSPIANNASKVAAIDDLIAKVRKDENLQANGDLLDMLTEIRKKIASDEPIPNFLNNGVKSILNDEALIKDFEAAIQ